MNTYPLPQTKLLRIDPPMMLAIRSYWHHAQLPSESEAVRRLIARGLAAVMEEKVTEDQAA
jgi:hypothetical protein